MPYNSQFQMYTSQDVGHPILTGTSGSLLSLLNSCLVTGYTSKTACGWTKTGSLYGAVADSASCGVFVQPTGSKATLFVSDNALGLCGARQARVTGFDAIQAFTSSVGAAPTSSITGSNQFPTFAQGIISARKSTDTSATERQWVVFADSSSVYCFMSTGDSAGMYYGFMFGDIFSIKSGSVDASKCLIVGNIAELVAGTVANDRLDVLGALNAAVTGHFVQRSYTGVGASLAVGKHGDGVKGSTTALLGTTQYPNGPDNGFYISPVWVTESAGSTVRGRMRGLYQACHAIASFTDGQTFQGGGDFAGKTFYIVKQSPNAGVFAIETSATVETN